MSVVRQFLEILDVGINRGGMSNVSEPSVVVIIDFSIKAFEELKGKIVPIGERFFGIMVGQPFHSLAIHVK